ncbi:ubiquitin carboxyl-terminal hydrolase 25 [Ziziphus jujuba]|uniref:Ubiquitin carboxyl-terminal hydrolase n=2 Tax=Ziziphus jujuba TaxID=326968 RepID=A0A6P4A3T7_ZIZJJ|nr:ubiquitin carboxyl-terminal hydrolase 25 [Ziziphus jujuba]KAH7522460.1 hypothetical protein FEM48_Zijuj07G0141000 [Ziziphus jujuba var. spinosa]
MGLQLQMSWQPSLLSQKRKNGPPLGLKNLGNSCYLNSVLQCLTYTPPLANFCLRNLHSSLCDSSDAERKRDCPFCILEKRIVRSLSLDLTLDAPMKIQSCLRIFAEHFRCGRQEDAHEFLRYVIDACHNTCLRLKKLRRNGNANANANGTSSSVVKEIFGGTLQSQVKCLSCGTDSNKVDEIMDISLDVLHSNSLKDALQRFFQSEVLDGNNKYKCESCKKLVPARKQMSILQAPNVLVIQLKRFEGIFGGKIDKSIAFEEVLVLSSFMCKASQDPRPEYKLFGTIVHSGFSPESGHYYAYIKDAMGRWYCCNDSFVSLSTVQKVLSEKVYILFFSRTNQRQESANIPASNISNGVKSRDCNGHEASKSMKPAFPPKGANIKLYESSHKDTPTISKFDKTPSSPLIKFNITGNSSSKRATAGNGKVVLKNQAIETNGNVNGSIRMEKLEKAKSTMVNRNGLNKTEKVDSINSEKMQAFVLAKENGTIAKVGVSSEKPDTCEDSGRGSLTKVREPDHKNLVNGGVNFHSEASGSKRKPQHSCILFAQDAESLAKVEELKEVLKEETSSVLQSCGWKDKIYSFMSSRKRLRTKEAGSTPDNNELRKLLVMDAKQTFISQIPESLKEDLIQRLRLFSQEK